MANNLSCRTLIGYYNVFRIKWMCLNTLRTALVHGHSLQTADLSAFQNSADLTACQNTGERM